MPMNAGRALPSKLGNELATNVGKGGPGAGRTIYQCGTQSQTPPAREMPKGRNTLLEFGPDMKGRSGGRS